MGRPAGRGRPGGGRWVRFRANEETRSWSVRTVESWSGWPSGRPWAGPGSASPPTRPRRGAGAAADAGSKPKAGDFALPGEDPPRDFVPAHPRTVAEQKRVESLRLFATARALEDRQQLTEAIRTLEQSLACDPESIPALRRLGRINFALGREAAGIAASRRALVVDPADVKTLAMLVEHYKDDLPAAEALLRETAANPKLDKNSVGALYVEYELGNLYDATSRPEKAAACFSKVVDWRSTRRRTPGSTTPSSPCFLGDDAAAAYHRFGRVFFAGPARSTSPSRRSSGAWSTTPTTPR